ncbi:hypothetical protein O9993_09625 [Vibrio lentus]|nr:hypothetical protein [Vibrio lentus]
MRIFELNKVHAIQRIMLICHGCGYGETMSGPMLEMFLGRHNQKVKSTIALAITDIITTLCRDNALSSLALVYSPA